MIARRWLGAVAVAGGAVLGVGDAGAAASVTSGWWTSAPVALAPDVPDGQLLVQGGVDETEPFAYAGISFSLAAGEAPASLTLDVAPGSASTPSSTLRLCLLSGPAADAAGAPATEAPGFDCATTVEAPPSADGTSYDFDVRAFAATDSLDVAVLPGLQTDRVVLVAPEAGALQGGGDGGSSSSGFTTSSTSSSSGASQSATSSGSSAGASTGRTAPSTASPAPARAPAPTTATTAPAPPAGNGANAEVALAPPAASASGTDSGGRSVAPFAFVALLIVAGGLWTVAGQSSAPEVEGDVP